MRLYIKELFLFHKEDMDMKLFNSMDQKIEDFKPMQEGKVNMYVCGPTVYITIHILEMQDQLWYLIH